jgi:hypothetical protein
MKKKNKPRANKRFNRLEFRGKHQYIREFTNPVEGDVRYDGLLKCKLVHGANFSVVFPELVLVKGLELSWIQPLYFAANLLWKADDAPIGCRVPVDISHGRRLWIEFHADQFIRRLDDGSELFHCVIEAPPKLNKYTTGRARIGEGYKIEIALYHHTKREAKQGILDSGYFWASHWNIQGTKELENVGYVYFTPLDAILAEEDLYQIAMASQEKLYLCRDNARASSPDDILELRVYRQSTADRRHTIRLWMEIDLLATQHVYRHTVAGNPVYYEIVHPFIHRVGLKPKCVLAIEGDRVTKKAQDLKSFDYAVIGDADSLSGLEAPYDEENTEHVLKIERCESTNILDFWMNNSNQDHFSGKNPEYLKFKANS